MLLDRFTCFGIIQFSITMKVSERSRQKNVVIRLRKHYVLFLLINHNCNFFKLRWATTQSLQVSNVNDPFEFDQQNLLDSLWITAAKSNVVDFC